MTRDGRGAYVIWEMSAKMGNAYGLFDCNYDTSRVADELCIVRRRGISPNLNFRLGEVKDELGKLNPDLARLIKNSLVCGSLTIGDSQGGYFRKLDAVKPKPSSELMYILFGENQLRTNKETCHELDWLMHNLHRSELFPKGAVFRSSLFYQDGQGIYVPLRPLMDPQVPYMRKKPGDEDWRRYEKETFGAEYGDADTKRSAKLRWIAIGFVLVIVLILVVAALASRS